MRAEAFFAESWSGAGEARGPFGWVLRRFTSRFNGRWSERDRAFHSEELVSYEGGPTLRRPWVVHTEEDGLLIGYDANQIGRMRVHNTAAGFTIRYDRPTVGSGPNVTRATIRFEQTAPDKLLARGTSSVLGVPIVRMQVRFERI